MQTSAKTAVIYRMVLPVHMCPSGLKARALLKSRGYNVEDHPLETREQVDAFKAKEGVKTTPQIWIEGAHIGGFSDLKAHFGITAKEGPTYRPVITLFTIAALMAIAVTWLTRDTLFVGQTIAWFIAISMVLLGLQKLQDIDAFATTFLGYDLLARRWVGYARIYPFVETIAGVLMLAGALTWLAAPATLFIAGIGAVSVVKAVYIENRSLKCACVGGGRNVPLGAISLLENLMMVGMALWMLAAL